MHAPADSQHDVVVVGARCAGSATARLLAARGYDVAVLERALLPSDTLSTHAIARGGVVQLSRWGLLDRVLATGAPPIRQVTFAVGGEERTRPVKQRAGVDLLVAPRRTALDGLLATAAAEAGADVRTGTSVTGLVRDDAGRVGGVRIRTRDGGVGTLRSRFVVGADGLRSGTARWVGARTRASFRREVSTFYTYVDDVRGAASSSTSPRAASPGSSRPTTARPACGSPGPPHCSSRSAPPGRDVPLPWSRPSTTSRRRSPGGSGPDASWPRCAAASTCPTTCATRTAPAGPWWGTRATTGTRSPGTASPTPSATPTCSPTRSPRRWTERPRATPSAATRRRGTRRWPATFRLTRELAAFPAPTRFVELQVELSEALEREALMLASRPAPVGLDAAPAA